MHCLGSILGQERIEEIVEIIFFSEVIFHKISWFLYMLLYFNFFFFFFIREQMTHLEPNLEDGLAPRDLSVREGDR